jgi:hypothetical protein
MIFTYAFIQAIGKNILLLQLPNEIDSYLDFRKRHGKEITNNSFLIVKKFTLNLNERIRGKQFGKESLQVLLDDNIRNAGLRQIDDVNHYKRKEVPRFMVLENSSLHVGHFVINTLFCPLSFDLY